MTNIPKLIEEAMERTFSSFVDEAPLLDDVSMGTYRDIFKRAITAFLSHIDQGISEEDAVRKMKKAFGDIRGHAAYEDEMQAAVRACPYRQIIVTLTPPMEVEVMSDELKDCPFCGSTTRHWNGEHPRFIACTNKQCEASISEGKDINIVKAWNTRTPPTGGKGEP